MSGQDNNLVNDEDSLNYVEQLFGYSTYLGQENKTHLLFSGDLSVLDLQTDNQGIHQNAFTQPINLTSGKYILFAKANPITKRQSSINHSNKSLYILCEDLFGQNKMLCFNSFNEQYCATMFIVSSDVNNLTFSFKTNQISSHFIISNVYLLKVDYKVMEPIYKIGGFSGFVDSSSTSDINTLDNLTFVNNEVHHLHQLDANLNQLIRYKYGYCKFFFTDSLKNIFFFSNSNTPEVFYDFNNSHTPFNNINIGVRKHLNSVNCIYSLISDNSNSNSFYISYLKTALTLENGTVHFECFTSSATYNYHNKLLCKTDFKGITTSNIYNNHLLGFFPHFLVLLYLTF